MNYKDYSYPFRLAADFILVALSFMVALVLTHRFGIDIRKRDVLHLLLLLYGFYHYSTKWGYYSDFMQQHLGHDLIEAGRMVIVLTIMFIVVGIMIEYGGNDRLAIFIFSPLAFLLLLIRRYIFRKFHLIFGQAKRTRVLFVGNSEDSRYVMEKMRLMPWLGYTIGDVIDVDKDYDLNELNTQLGNSLRDKLINRVFIVEARVRRKDLDDIVTLCQSYTVQTFVLPQAVKYATNRYALQFFHEIPLISVAVNPLDAYVNQLLKRVFDIAISSLALIFLIPVFLILIVLIKATSKGPALFIQKRWGINNVPFDTYKFRSMVATSSDLKEGKYQQATRNDPRITSIGAFIRKTNLDELPQFINVLFGDMSVVGPRPHPGPLNEESIGVVDRYLQRHLVKPGITGWAQVNGYRGETKTTKLMQKRVDLDIWYIENWSIWLDIRIIILTAWSMLKGQETAY